MLLNDFVRLNQAIKKAGGSSEVDLYEGMVHAFPAILVGAPESNAVLKEATTFWGRTLSAAAR